MAQNQIPVPEKDSSALFIPKKWRNSDNANENPRAFAFLEEYIYSVSRASNSSKFYLPCHPEPLDTCKHLPVMDQLDGQEYQKDMDVEIRRLYLCPESVARYRRFIEQVREIFGRNLDVDMVSYLRVIQENVLLIKILFWYFLSDI
ncbi:hypothetical protein NPIL_417761 [Nephila pilipes]|uniref:Uncharacterized protein n=1 Tax=Nephila pilipes TaxID=299642 RepID=A0A8X6TCG9_NEPPI|nr:hypothetical protein NPIL_417761 [Nephila pilipes]